MKWNSISLIIKITYFFWIYYNLCILKYLDCYFCINFSVYKIAIIPTVINYVKAMNTISWIQGVFLEILKILEREALANV